ncbi:MAG: methyltransferase domain-containing protein [Planctomycetes bacterium]|nr:methyltransferase domain-containing protein [Planctomycetota bacterium]
MDLRRLAESFATSFRRYAGRLHAADRYLRGEGLEIGALAEPLALPKGARARYVDIAPTEELRKLYPRGKRRHLVDVDVVDDGETLRTVANESQDFVIANHFLEHAEDPITAIQNLLRVVRRGGVLYLTIPDKRFDAEEQREATSYEHLLRDHEQGPEVSRSNHYADAVQNGANLPAAVETAEDAAVAVLEWQEHRIRFHCWSQTEILELMVKLQRRSGFPIFEVEHFSKNQDEMVLILRRKA